MINDNTGGGYAHCISLGWFCGTASAMGINGLRSFSGPFDWYFSDLMSVLKMIEENFSDFLNKNNLRVIDDNSKEFQDIKYGFYYMHEVKEDFENEYDLIVKKYRRRIENFLTAIKEPTCFFRAVRSESEVKYIDENKMYIDKIIKQSNPQNRIIYLLLNTMPAPANEVCFYLNINEYVGKAYDMLTMFNGSKELLDYSGMLIDEQNKKANQKFWKRNSTHSKKTRILISYIGIKQKLSKIFG